MIAMVDCSDLPHTIATTLLRTRLEDSTLTQPHWKHKRTIMNVHADTNEPGMLVASRCPNGAGSPHTTAISSSDDENPLMKLVDAALAPNCSEGSDKVKDESTGQKVVVDAMETDELPSKEPDDSSKPTLQDAKVIKGNVDDLMTNQDKKVTFAEFLMEVLNSEENHDVLQWMPCGTQFTITNHRKFTMERMPELFKIRNMSSFVRKLTRWGFARVHEKETGNSDIFKHHNFQRDKPELCRKIRCVNRATASNSAHVEYGRPMDAVMGSLSEASVSSRHVSERHMMTPQRRMIPGSCYPPHHTRTPYGGPRPYGPRVSPEYEKEMMPGSAFRPSRPGPPQVYSPTSPVGMTAAAEYELEQILLQRQQARAAAAFRHQHQRHSPPTHLGIPMGTGSERSMGSGSDRNCYSNDFIATSSGHAVSSALENLQREGEYDLDMSPREAMLRAILHKRQQQRAAARALGGGGRPSPATAPYSSHHHHGVESMSLPPRGSYYR